MAKDRVSIKDIANTAQVSLTTAYYALSGKGRLSDATRKRVQEVAKQLGYRRNHLASSLRRQRSSSVGVVLPAISSQVYESVARGIEGVLSEHGYASLLGCSYTDSGREVELVESLLESAVEGLIILPADSYRNNEYFKSLLDQEIPLVFAQQSMLGIAADWVSDDNEWAGYLAAQHLVKLGRTRLVYLATPELLETSTGIQERFAGCQHALADASLPPAELLGADQRGVTNIERYAFEMVGEATRSGRDFDGLVAAFDSFAFGALGALAQHGVRVPDEVSVVGCDDVYQASYSSPALTTIRLESEQVGMQAARMLLDRMRHDTNPPLVPRHVQLQPTLIVRGSSGPLREVSPGQAQVALANL